MHQRRHARFWRRWLTRWLIARLQRKSVDMRTYILQALGKIGDESALPAILESSRDVNSTIRRFAVSALADMGGTQAIDALIVALDDPETDIRVAAVIALGGLGGKRAEESLKSSKSLNDLNDLNDLNNFNDFSDFNVERSTDALIGLLDDEEISVRNQVVIALGHLCSSKALPLLNQMMDAESNEWMRRYISQAVREIEGGCST